MITFKVSGDWNKTLRFLNKASNLKFNEVLNKAGSMGVQALSGATPTRSGKTASSWTYDVKSINKGFKITWRNTNMNRGYCIAMLIQHGHGTGWGGYVQGIDYINPAMAPVFQEIAEMVWREVTS